MVRESSTRDGLKRDFSITVILNSDIVIGSDFHFSTSSEIERSADHYRALVRKSGTLCHC